MDVVAVGSLDYKQKHMLDKMLKEDTTLRGGLLEGLHKRGLSDSCIQDDTLVFISYSNGLIDGIAFLNELASFEYELTYLWVAPRRRGCGVGGLLVDNVLKYTVDSVLDVSTWSTNKPQVALLESKNFELVSKKSFPLAGFELLFYTYSKVAVPN